MFSKALVAATLAYLASAAPARRQTTSNHFDLIAIRSGDEYIHQRSINFNDQGLWIGKDTTAACPSDDPDVNCGDYTSSISALTANADSSATLVELYTGATTSSQQLYVLSNGTVSYDELHSNTVPEGAYTEFGYSSELADGQVGRLTSDDGEFVACPTADDEVYQVFATVPGFTGTGCLDIGVGTGNYTGSPAWQYL